MNIGIHHNMKGALYFFILLLIFSGFVPTTALATSAPLTSKLQASTPSVSNLKTVDLMAGDTISNVKITDIYLKDDPQDVTADCQWSSSNSKVVTVDLKGVITGKAKGSSTVTATFNKQKVSFKVNVIPQIESFTVEAKSIMVEKGKTLSAKAVVYYDNNTKVTVTTKATWSSDNENIATVSKGIIKGIGKGTAKITAIYVIAQETYTATYAVDVNPKLTGLISTPLTVGVNENVTPVVQATYLEEDAPIDVTSSCTFKSSSISIATVNINSGLITGVKKGKATITAMYNNKKVAINVTVGESENPDQPKWSVLKDIPDSQSILWPSISSDGNTIVGLDARYSDFNKYNDTCEIKVYEFSKGQWQSPKIIGNNGIKSSFPLVETHPVISGDGKTIMYFGLDSVNNTTKYYQVIKDSEGIWGNPTIVESIPDTWFGTLASLDSTGTTFSYLQGTGGFFGGTQTLFIVEKKDGVWQRPKAISAPGYSGASESPTLSSDGTKIAWVQANTYFDVMFSEKVNGEWLEPTVLTRDDENDQKVTLSGDGNTILFTKIYMNGNVMESYNLFSITRNAGSWGEAVKINSSKETPTIIYDSKLATDFSGSRVVYTHFVVHTEGQDNVISEGYLVASYYKDGKWTKPTAITSTKDAYGCYHYSSELTSDGNKAIFCSPNGLSYITSSI